jgi:hypothetical protein
MSGVFDDRKTVAGGQGPYPIEVAGPASQMYRNDRARPRGYAAFDRPWIDISVWTNVGEDRRGADLQNGVHGRAKRERRGDDFVAGADAERRECEMQGRRA